MSRLIDEWVVPTEKVKAPPRPVQPAAIAGFLGAILVFAIQLALQVFYRGEAPLGMMFATGALHLRGMTAMITGTLLFCIGGLFFGYLYARLIETNTLLNALLYSLVPWLISMLIIRPLAGKPAFGGGDWGIILKALLLSLLWGAVVAGFLPLLNKSRLTS